MKVWIVSRGEKHEGVSPRSVHRYKLSAVKAALAEKTHFPGGWVKDMDGYTDARGIDERWVNGCDVVQVQRHEVVE